MSSEINTEISTTQEKQDSRGAFPLKIIDHKWEANQLMLKVK